LGGPTLSRDDEEDVEFDMDTVLRVMETEEYYWEEMLSSEMDRAMSRVVGPVVDHV
jgi:hypothetical protein